MEVQRNYTQLLSQHLCQTAQGSGILAALTGRLAQLATANRQVGSRTPSDAGTVNDIDVGGIIFVEG